MTTVEPQTRSERTAGLGSPGAARLYADPLRASRTGALFNAFSYPTKISAEAVALFIATHTAVGDTVLDAFAGSGTTGIAAKLCDRPTPGMLKQALELGLEPAWGPRAAVLYELSTLGAFVSRTLCEPIDPDEFEREATALLGRAEAACSTVYETTDDRGATGVLRHAVWSEVLVCSACGAETSYWDACVRHSPLRLEKTFHCPGCGVAAFADSVERASESTHDALLGVTIERRKRRLVRVEGISGTRRWRRTATSDDERRYRVQSASCTPDGAPIAALKWGDLHRRGYHFGISHLHHLYTERNFGVMARLWSEIETAPVGLQNALRLLVLSYNASHGTLMTRIVVKSGQKDFSITGAQSGVLYVSGLPVEKNLFRGIQRKIGTLREAFATLRGSRSAVIVENRSSTLLDLSDASVSYVFTDPPFGDFIPYAEINQVNELWLGEVTDRTNEVIVSQAQGKTVEIYAQLMRAVFSEIRRVLKPDGCATVVFHSARAEVWRALVDSTQAAGLRVEATSILNKVQESFKQVVSTVSVKGDPLILLKPITGRLESRARAAVDPVEFALSCIERDGGTGEGPERLYSQYVGHCIAEGVPVNVDAGHFYSLVRATMESVRQRARARDH